MITSVAAPASANRLDASSWGGAAATKGQPHGSLETLSDLAAEVLGLPPEDNAEHAAWGNGCLAPQVAKLIPGWWAPSSSVCSRPTTRTQVVHAAVAMKLYYNASMCSPSATNWGWSLNTSHLSGLSCDQFVSCGSLPSAESLYMHLMQQHAQ